MPKSRQAFKPPGVVKTDQKQKNRLVEKIAKKTQA